VIQQADSSTLFVVASAPFAELDPNAASQHVLDELAVLDDSLFLTEVFAQARLNLVCKTDSLFRVLLVSFLLFGKQHHPVSPIKSSGLHEVDGFDVLLLFNPGLSNDRRVTQ